MPDVSFKTYAGFMRLSSRPKTRTSMGRLLVAGPFAVDAMIGGAKKMTRFGINPNGMRVALLGTDDGMAHFSQSHHGLGILSGCFEAGLIGKPLMMKPGCIDRRANVHVEVDHIHEEAENRVDDRAAA